MRSRNVVLTTTLVAAAAIGSGCSRPDQKRCVSQDGTVVRDEECERIDRGSFGAVGAYAAYRWYYGGRGGHTPGALVSGGSYTPTPGKSYVPASSISRGGFGSSASHVGA